MRYDEEINNSTVMIIHSTPLYSPGVASMPRPSIFNPYHLRRPLSHDLTAKNLAARLDFRKITHEKMPEIWEILKREPGRTTDFSYGGVLMWVDYFHYEYAIIEETLFIKGRVESDISKVAFSLPVGNLPLEKSVAILREYCRINGLPLIFSAVPEYAIDKFRQLNPSKTEELGGWADYLYDAEPLASLKGKKMSKKRNHVNQFIAAYPDFKLEPLTPANAAEAKAFMNLIDAEGDGSPMAVSERNLNRLMLDYVSAGDRMLLGAILREGNGNILAYTIGDIKGDTLFIHIEKALRSVPGGFEMINKSFADLICREHPEIRFINREDDSGDMGLRMAKESYHPIELLRKYNILM